MVERPADRGPKVLVCLLPPLVVPLGGHQCQHSTGDLVRFSVISCAEMLSCTHLLTVDTATMS